MSIETIETEEGFCLKVKNKKLVGDEAADLKAAASELMNKGVKSLSLDLLEPEYIDSSGIGKILFLNKKLVKAGGIFSICSINQPLYDFLDSLAIPKVVNIADPN